MKNEIMHGNRLEGKARPLAVFGVGMDGWSLFINTEYRRHIYAPMCLKAILNIFKFADLVKAHFGKKCLITSVLNIYIYIYIYLYKVSPFGHDASVISSSTSLSFISVLVTGFFWVPQYPLMPALIQ